MAVIRDREQGTTRNGPSSPPHELSASQKGHKAAHQHIQCLPRGWEGSQPRLTHHWAETVATSTPPTRAAHLGHPEQIAKQQPVCPSWAASPIPKYIHPTAKPFSHCGKKRRSLVLSHFQPRSPMGSSGPRSFRVTDVILSPSQGLAKDTACQARTGSVYLYPAHGVISSPWGVGGREALWISLPLFGIGDRSAMNHTANSSPQPLPTGVWRTAFCCQLKFSQSQEWLSLVTLRSCCQALQGVVLGLPWGFPHVPSSSHGLSICCVHSPAQFRDEESSNGSLRWASPSKNKREGWGSKARVTAGEGAHQTESRQVTSLSHQPVSTKIHPA